MVPRVLPTYSDTISIKKRGLNNEYHQVQNTKNIKLRPLPLPRFSYAIDQNQNRIYPRSRGRPSSQFGATSTEAPKWNTRFHRPIVRSIHRRKSNLKFHHKREPPRKNHIMGTIRLEKTRSK